MILLPFHSLPINSFNAQSRALFIYTDSYPLYPISKSPGLMYSFLSRLIQLKYSPIYLPHYSIAYFLPLYKVYYLLSCNINLFRIIYLFCLNLCLAIKYHIPAHTDIIHQPCKCYTIFSCIYITTAISMFYTSACFPDFIFKAIYINRTIYCF